MTSRITAAAIGEDGVGGRSSMATGTRVTEIEHPAARVAGERAEGGG